MTAPEERVLDYRPGWDDRNRAFPITTALRPTTYRTWRYWRQGEILDQGREGACVGFGWTAELMASPERVKIWDPTNYARGVYHDAQRIDEWPGEDYEGTSVLAGAKVVQSRGLIEQYRWAFTTEDIIDTLLQVGPVVVGIPWYYNMYETLPGGLVQLGGPMVGGHCLTLTGYSKNRWMKNEVGKWERMEVFRWTNSWGRSYGKYGRGYIRVSDFAQLFNQYGEACVPLGRVLPEEEI